MALGAGTYRGRIGESLYETEMPRTGEVIDLGGRRNMHTSYPYQTLNLGRAHTGYPYQTLTLGTTYGGAAPFGVRPYAGTRRLHGLGQTGEEIDAMTPPQEGERLFYRRQAEGDAFGALAGLALGVAYLTSKMGKRATPYMRAVTGAGLPVAGLFVGRAIRQRMARGNEA